MTEKKKENDRLQFLAEKENRAEARCSFDQC